MVSDGSVSYDFPLKEIWSSQGKQDAFAEGFCVSEKSGDTQQVSQTVVSVT